jgi:hypothetical protein
MVAGVKRGLVLIACGLTLALLVSACGGGGGDGLSAAESLAVWARSIEHEVAGEEPVADLHFDPIKPPFESPVLLHLTAVGVATGRRVAATGSRITDAFAGTPRQKKHLVCFVTAKELDGELPRDPAQLLADIAQYFGEEFVDEEAYLHYLDVTKDYLDEVGTMEEHGVLSVNTGLATVCNA